MKKALISFVGKNDKGTDSDSKESEGAIITALTERKYDILHLLWNPTKTGEYDFYRIAEHVKETAIKEKYFTLENIHLHPFQCENVTDHNEIYPKLLELCRSLPKGTEYTAAIASGTPSMQVCWILMAESGDFKMKLIRSNEPRFGKPLVTDIKLGTGLPRIKKQENKISNLIKDIKKNLSPVEVDKKNLKINIAGEYLRLSHIEFCYYLYFLKRANYDKPGLRVANNNPPEEFVNDINRLFKQLFPNLDRIKPGTNFQSNVSKVNKEIKRVIDNAHRSKYYLINGEGLRGSKSYKIDLKPSLIKIRG